MSLKKLLIPLMVLLIASQALATVTVTVNQPNGQTFFPITQNQRFMDVNITVIDDNAANSIHTAIIQFDSGDGNTAIATDLNLDTGNCSFDTTDDWSDPGADCIVRFTFPRTGTILPTRSYVLDANVTGRDSAEDNFGDGTGINTFSIDNRLVSTNVLAILTLSTLILAGILIFFLIGFLGGSIEPNVMVFIAIVGIGAIIGIILVSEFLLLLTP